MSIPPATSTPAGSMPAGSTAAAPTPASTVTAGDVLTTDVVVVGAGPAGAAAAIALRRAGRDVVMIDKATFPRDKCCGDGLTTLALRELEALGFHPDSVPDWFDVDGADIRSPAGKRIFVPLPDDGKYAAVAPRLELDNELVELARSVGVDVRDGHGIGALHQDTDRLAVTAGDLEIHARYLVAADGMWSPVRKAVGVALPGYLGEWHGFRQYAHNVTGEAAHQLFVWFEPDLLPGYAWSFPLPGGRANVGFGVLRDGSWKGNQLKALWDDLLARPHIAAALGPDATMEDRHTAWPIPARIDEVPLTSGRVLFVGDAAAATDVMTGEGIGQALLTGRLAAEAITAAGALRPELATRWYQRAVHDELQADHRMSLRLGRVLRRRRGTEGALAIVAHSGTWGRRNFARWMFEDEPRAIVLTPRRWHRRFLDRPGAYRAA